ncbi:hypothetical protein BDZ88DRAFT_171870 [Geranomyces variabilis]|nr:hypothetical protein BDZ88DRAFT_171870 [Geranomyces variabilis]KAJ3140188.1 hypothetical protein HDU90_008412 [Geranomyces variabilis]
MTAAHLARTDVSILRRAAGHVVRKVMTGVRDKSGGCFYMFERTDLLPAQGGPVVFKFGVDFMEDINDEVDTRIEEHENGACKAEIDHHLTSVYFDDIYRYVNLVNKFLEPVLVPITCPCSKNHNEYFQASAWTAQMGLAVWKWAADNATTNFFCLNFMFFGIKGECH